MPMYDILDCAKKIYISYKSKRKCKKNQNAFEIIASMFSRRCGSYMI